jgi:hypothetical protein
MESISMVRGSMESKENDAIKSERCGGYTLVKKKNAETKGERH